MSTDTAAGNTAPYVAARGNPHERYLFGPVIDFLCLGGTSLLILPLLLLVPADQYDRQLSFYMLMLANVINHPHFAHSYQLFYRGFRRKAFTAELGGAMQARYLLSGIVVPVLLLAFFAYCILRQNVPLLGQAANIMALFVGWHYVKQGYGMLMLDAVLKRNFFKDREKKVLLVNSYVVWIAAWISANAYVRANELWGLQYYSFDFPDVLVELVQVAALLTTAAACWALYTHWRASRRLLVNGIMAYGVSLYAWRLFVAYHPLWILVVPAMHSLQYLIVVWRFELNYGKEQFAHAEHEASSAVSRLLGGSLIGHLVLFAVTGVAFGYLGFWGLPTVLDQLVPYDQKAFGGTLFLFVAWIFINVHHYFLDNVMWRRENPDTKRFLFS